jgi:hypothetical protein
MVGTSVTWVQGIAVPPIIFVGHNFLNNQSQVG